jgi:TPR repeat protein
MKRLSLFLLFTASTAFAQNYGGVWRPLDELKSGQQRQAAPKSQQQPTPPRNDIDISKLDYKAVERQAKSGNPNALFFSGLMILTGQAGVELNEDNAKRALLLIKQASLRGNADATNFLNDMEEEGIEYALQRQIKGISD